MSTKTCISLLLLCTTIPGIAQLFELRGLEMYNPVYHNPAFTGSEKRIKTDLIAYDYNYYSGFWLNSMHSIKNTNSSIGLSLSSSRSFAGYTHNSKLEEIGRWKGIGLAYSYKKSFNDNFSISSGISLGYSLARLDYSALENSDTRYGRIQGLTTKAGIKLGYRKFYAGASFQHATFKLINLEFKNNDKDRRIYWFDNPGSNIILGYSFGGERRLNFDPIVGFQSYFVKRGSRFNETGWFAGAKLTLVKTVGLGFTLGSQQSLSAFISVLDKVDLRLGVFQLSPSSNITSIAEYTVSFEKPYEYIMQLSVKF